MRKNWLAFVVVSAVVFSFSACVPEYIGIDNNRSSSPTSLAGVYSDTVYTAQNGGPMNISVVSKTLYYVSDSAYWMLPGTCTNVLNPCSHNAISSINIKINADNSIAAVYTPATAGAAPMNADHFTPPDYIEIGYTYNIGTNTFVEMHHMRKQ